MKIARRLHYSKKDIIFNAICLFIALLLLLSTIHESTFSWLFNKKTADVNTESFLKVHATEGLRMGYSESKFLTSPIIINNIGNSLSECTSVDGKNVFFPISEYTKQNYGSDALVGDGEVFNNANTQDFLFRKANANDKNKKYISIDFTLSSDVTTGVWLSNDSQIIGTAKDAIRISIFCDDDSDPIILDSSIKDYSSIDNVVTSITPHGTIASSNRQVAKSISNYIFTNESDGKQLFTIQEGETINLTLNVWLEGADSNCAEDILYQSDLSVNIKFVTDIENPQYVYFYDDTATKWIEDDNNVMYVFDKKTEFAYEMTKSDSYDEDFKWIGKIPNTTEEVIFIRKTSEDDNNALSWDAMKCTGGSDEYHAFGRGLSGGYWKSSPTLKDFYFADNTDTQWVSSNNADIFVSFTATDANNGSKEIAYFMDCIGEHQSLIGQTVYQGKTVVTGRHYFYRYVNQEQDLVNSWNANRTLSSRNLFTITGVEGSSTGKWSTLST